MNVTKYKDLNQELAKSEKQLYEKISEDFEIAISDSVETIKKNVDSISEIVNKVQFCKESYEEAAEIVGGLRNTLSDTDKKIVGINKDLDKLSEEAGKSTSNLSERVSTLLELSDDFVTKNRENEVVIKDTCENIQKLGKEYRSSIEVGLEEIKKIENEVQSTEERIEEYTKKISDSSALLQCKTESSISLFNDISSKFEKINSGFDLYFDSINEKKESLIKVTNDIQGTEETINNVNESFCQLEERVDAYNKRIVDEIDGYLCSVKQEIDDVVSQTEKFAALLSKNSVEVTGLIDSQQKWKESYDVAFNEVVKSVERLIVDLNEKNESVCSENELMQEHRKTIQFCVDDVKRSTDEYVKLVQEANVSLLESFEIFKSDFLNASNEQIRLICEVKEEQIKQKKIYLLGLIPTIIILVLQMINILS